MLSHRSDLVPRSLAVQTGEIHWDSGARATSSCGCGLIGCSVHSCTLEPILLQVKASSSLRSISMLHVAVPPDAPKCLARSGADSHTGCRRAPGPFRVPVDGRCTSTLAEPARGSDYQSDGSSLWLVYLQSQPSWGSIAVDAPISPLEPVHVSSREAGRQRGGVG
jgi:hypothetical protein